MKYSADADGKEGELGAMADVKLVSEPSLPSVSDDDE